MRRSAWLNAHLAPYAVPVLAPAGVLMAAPGGDTLVSPTGGAWAMAEMVLVVLSVLWQRRGRRNDGGRHPVLAVALWVFAGLATMLLLYKMLWGLEHAGGVLAEGRDVLSRSVQAVAFYAGAAWLTSRRPEASPPGPAASSP